MTSGEHGQRREALFTCPFWALRRSRIGINALPVGYVIRILPFRKCKWKICFWKHFSVKMQYWIHLNSTAPDGRRRRRKSNYMTGSDSYSPPAPLQFPCSCCSCWISLLIGIELGRCQAKGCDIKIATIFYAKQTETEKARGQKDSLRFIDGALIINVKWNVNTRGDKSRGRGWLEDREQDMSATRETTTITSSANNS